MVLLPCYHGNVISLTSFYTLFRYDCNVILLYCVTSVAVYLAIIPVCHVFGIMLAFFALLGVHMGIIDTVANSILIKIHGKKVRVFYGAYSLTWPASMQIYGNKRNVLHKKRVQPPQDLFGTPTWPPFIVLENQYGRDVMWIRSICRLAKERKSARKGLKATPLLQSVCTIWPRH